MNQQHSYRSYFDGISFAEKMICDFQFGKKRCRRCPTIFMWEFWKFSCIFLEVFLNYSSLNAAQSISYDITIWIIMYYEEHNFMAYLMLFHIKNVEIPWHELEPGASLTTLNHQGESCWWKTLPLLSTCRTQGSIGINVQGFAKICQCACMTHWKVRELGNG